MIKKSVELDTIQKLTPEEMQLYTDNVARVYDHLYFYILKIVRNSDVAWDVLHDTLLAGRLTFKKLLDKDKFDQWIFKIGKFKSLDELKRQNKLDLVDDISYFDSIKPSSYNSTEDIVVKNELIELVKNYIEKLPTNYKRILFYYYFHSFSFKEIAKSFDMNYNTVVSTHKRALEIIAKRTSEDSLMEYLEYEIRSEVF